jgi:hypothetical protein
MGFEVVFPGCHLFGGIFMGVEVSDLEAGRWTIDPAHSEITSRSGT